MRKFIKKRSGKIGLAPGTIKYIGEKKSVHSSISLIDYSKTDFTEKTIDSFAEVIPFKSTSSVSWINITGLNDTELLKQFGESFAVHPLVLSDIVNTDHRPKMEDYQDYLYFVIKMLSFDEIKKEILSEQVSIILTSNCVISFQEREGDVFEPIRDRIRNNKGRIRQMGSDYLAYLLLDAVIEHYFVILEKLGDLIEPLEDRLLNDPAEQSNIKEIYKLKHESLFLRKSIWPLREVTNNFQKIETSLINNSTRVFLRDLYDHTVQIIDTIETMRDMLSGMIDLYLSSVSNKMNEVMKVLTIIGSIFIPLTFLAGIYGMNFKFMPELEWKWGYYSLISLMVVLVIVMVCFFKKKKWI